jgi:non-ribosomal peptide synthetase component F
VGEVGEIYVRSPHMAKGYVGLPDQTAAKFLTNPFTNAEHDRLCVPAHRAPPVARAVARLPMERLWAMWRATCVRARAARRVAGGDYR